MSSDRSGGEGDRRRLEWFDTPQRTGPGRERLVALLADGGLTGTRLLGRLHELRRLDGFPACSAAVHLIAHLDLPEAEAEDLLVELLRHREELRCRLGRDPGLQVAAIDFLSNVQPLLRNPAVVELSQLEETERDAVTDPLTDLYNRRYFQSALDVEIRRSKRYGLSLSLLLLDLDSFKSVNDVYGHPFGDLVLRRAGHVIRRAVRESDTACRFGGEEFAVILPETDRVGAYAVAERVRRHVEEDFAESPVEHRLVTMTISGGVACYPADGATAELLIERADRALYRSKAAGRNKIMLHHSERRRSVRYPVKRSARARLAMPTRGAEELPARALNLSRHGALLEASGPCGPADPVELRLEGGPVDAVVRGHIVRVEPGDDGPAYLRIAVRFDQPLGEERLRDHVVRGRSRSAARRRRP